MSDAACPCGDSIPAGRTGYCSGVCEYRYKHKGRGPDTRRAVRTVVRVRVPAVCLNCGREFLALKNAVRKFCSVRCSGIHAKAIGRFDGANNPRWRGGVSNDNMRYRKRQLEREPVQEAARRAVRAAIVAGRLIRQSCERCGVPNAQAHHDDYSQPLAVRWLCRRHHNEVHRELKATGIDPMERVRAQQGT